MARPRVWKLVPALVLLASGGAARAGAAPADAPAPGWPTAGWPTSTPEAQGMDSAKLAAMLAFLGDQGYAVDGVLIVRHGRLVLEAYASPYGPETPHLAWSTAKSLASLLFGVAVGEGKLAGADQRLSSVFQAGELGAGMEERTFRDLLTMTSGIGDPRPPKDGEDWLRMALATPAARPPGRFQYSNVSAHIVLAAVARATGVAGPDYAREKLFDPMGMKGVAFGTDARGQRDGGDRLELLPRDLAKLGYLCLRRGAWDGKQLVPADWIAASTRRQVGTHGEPLGKHGYGWFWWMEDFGGYSAMGYGSQYVFVVPEKDLVVVFTANMPNDYPVPRAMMRDFILPAIGAEGALPPAPGALAALREEVERMR